MTVRSAGRYHSPADPQDILRSPGFKDPKVEVFVRIGASRWAMFAPGERRAADRRAGICRALRHAVTASAASVRVRFRHGSPGRPSGSRPRCALPALIGSGPDADVKTPRARRCSHARVFERDGEIVLQAVAPELALRLSGESVHEAVLREGDVIELGPGGPRLRLEAADDVGGEMLVAAPWARRGLARVGADALPHAGSGSEPGGALSWWPPACCWEPAAGGYSYWQDRKLRLEIERLRDALRESEARARGLRGARRRRALAGGGRPRRARRPDRGARSARRSSTGRSARAPRPSRATCAASCR